MLVNLSVDELWVIATCAVCGAACAIPGVFLMLRRSALLGDAISHAILPGITVAFMISGERSPIFMLLGAALAGLLTALLSSLLSQSTILKKDAALGIVFTTMFAIGVLLLTWGARNVDLDPGCVLYGLAELTPFDTTELFSMLLPRSFVWLSIILLINISLVSIFFKELKLSSFDPVLASALGFNTTLIHYVLITSVTITAVASFEAVGSILVISMLITPAATAYLLTDRLGVLIFIAAALGIVAAFGGYAGALTLNTSVAGMMSVVSGVIFAISLVVAPRHGLAQRVITRAMLRYRILRDDILGRLYRWHEVVGRDLSNPLTHREIYQALGRSILTRLALRSLIRRGEVVRALNAPLHLTERGMLEAQALVRSHRLWESYLAKHLGLALDHLHIPSERTEHFIGLALTRELEKELATKLDPHGKVIP